MTSWSVELGLPIPPLDAVAPTAFSAVALAFYAVFALVGAAFALKDAFTTGRPVLLMMVIGGGLTVVAEPFVDLMGAAWHPRFGHTIVFTMFGRPIPWWMVAAYFAYFGTLGLANYAAFRNGATMRAIRLWFLVPMLIDVAIEEIMLHQDLYLYYGHQPLILLGKLPFWWVPCNSIGEFIGVALCVVLAPRLRGLQLALIAIVIPLSDMVGYAAIAWPCWVVINTAGVPGWLVQLAGLATFALAFLIVHSIALLLGTDSPYRKSDLHPRLVNA